MKITGIRLGHLSIPLRTPFKTAVRTATRIEDVLVKIITDQGAVGYGSAALVPAITGDTEVSIRTAIEGPIKKLLIGSAVENFEELMVRLHTLAGVNSGAKAAVDIALYDLYGRLQSLPVYKLLRGDRKELTTDITISLNEPDVMARDSLDAVSRGFKTLKVKVGSHPAKDMERLRAIRAAVGDSVNLRLDDNQGWTPEEAVSLIEKMEDEGFGLDLVEQPVNRRDLEGLKYVTDRVGVPVVADESAFSPRDVADWRAGSGRSRSWGWPRRRGVPPRRRREAAARPFRHRNSTPPLNRRPRSHPPHNCRHATASAGVIGGE